MGTWTGTVWVDRTEYGILLDSVTMRPVALPLFKDEAAADGFLHFASAHGYPDVRRMSPDSLDRLHGCWVDAGEPDVPEEPEDEESLAPLLEASIAVTRGAKAVRT